MPESAARDCIALIFLHRAAQQYSHDVPSVAILMCAGWGAGKLLRPPLLLADDCGVGREEDGPERLLAAE